MLGLTFLVVSVALADSINPSTLIPALWLATAPSAGRLASYTLGVFAIYLTGGLVLLLGPGRVLIAALHHLGAPLEHGLEAAGGLIVLAVAFSVWRSHAGSDARPRSRRVHSRASAFALGAGIMAVELPTAFMYFGVISAILAAHPAAPFEISLLTVYNAIFVAPLAAFIAIRRLAGARTDRWIASAEDRLRYAGRLALTSIAAIAGAALLGLGLTGLLDL